MAITAQLAAWQDSSSTRCRCVEQRRSVSERFTVCRSLVSGSAKSPRSHEHVQPAAIELGERRAPRDDVQRRTLLRRRLREDQRPFGKSNAGEPTLPGTFAPRSFQRSRPAIIRWITIQRSPRPRSNRLPSRSMVSTCTLELLRFGANVRSTNTLAIRIFSSCCRSSARAVARRRSRRQAAPAHAQPLLRLASAFFSLRLLLPATAGLRSSDFDMPSRRL